MTTKRKRKPAPGTPAAAREPNPPLPREAEDIILRLLACAMGLPRICVLKVCRQHRQCRGAGIVCGVHHRGLVKTRIDAAIRRISTPGAQGDLNARGPRAPCGNKRKAFL